MKNNSFIKWIDEFVEENNIDKLQTFEIIKNKKQYCFTVEKVIDYIKIIDPEAQKTIKRMLEKIVKNKWSVVDYFQCLSVGVIATTEEYAEENEETM